MLYSVLFRFGHIRRWDQCAVYTLSNGGGGGVMGFSIGNFSNVRSLGKSVVVFRLFEKLRYSNKRLTKIVSVKQE